MKYEEYERRRKKDAELEKASSAGKLVKDAAVVQATDTKNSNQQHDADEAATSIFRHRWQLYWQVKLSSSGDDFGLT